MTDRYGHDVQAETSRAPRELPGIDLVTTRRSLSLLEAFIPFYDAMTHVARIRGLGLTRTTRDSYSARDPAALHRSAGSNRSGSSRSAAALDPRPVDRLADHVALGGGQGLEAAVQVDPAALIATVTDAGFDGRASRGHGDTSHAAVRSIPVVVIDELCADVHVSIIELDLRVIPLLERALAGRLRSTTSP